MVRSDHQQGPKTEYSIVEKVTSGLFWAGMASALSIGVLLFGGLKLAGSDAMMTVFAHAFGYPEALKEAKEAEVSAQRDLFIARNENIRLERENRDLLRQAEEMRRVVSSAQAEAQRSTRQLDQPDQRNSGAENSRRMVTYPSETAAPLARPQGLTLIAAVAEMRRGWVTVSAEMKNVSKPEVAFRIVAPRPVLVIDGAPASSEFFQAFCPQEDCRSSLRPPTRLGEGDTQRVNLRFFSENIEPASLKKLELEITVQTESGTRLTLRTNLTPH